MNKKFVKICLSVFYGVNFIFLILYGLFEALISKILAKPDDMPDGYSDQKENQNLFIIIIGIPIISLLIMVLFPNLISIQIILLIYGILQLLTVPFLIFSKNGIYVFSDEQEKILPNFKEFSFFVIFDAIYNMILVFYYSIQITVIFYIELIIQVMLFLYIAQTIRLYLAEKKTFSKVEKNQEILNYQIEDSNKMIKNIVKLEEIIEKTLESKDFILAEKYSNYLIEKYKFTRELMEKKEEKKKSIQLNKKFLLSKENHSKIQDSSVNQKLNNLYKKIEEAKLKESFPEIGKFNNEIEILLKDQLVSAKKSRNKREIEKYTQKLNDFLSTKKA